jgi:NADH-quinone oxidoreductase subunit F
MSPPARSILLGEVAVTSVDQYVAAGGGQGLRRAREMGPDAVIATIRAAGLRGRGGAGFPTGIKWGGLRSEDADRKFVVCNAAEGEPGTFKDRRLLRDNPYQVLEGVAIAAFAVGAEWAYVATKGRFGPEIAALERAGTEMSAAGIAGDVPINIVEGPDDYLFGEEKALLEVVEGRDPLPRLYPPYVQGLFADQERSNPAVVNNVETLANVPHIVGNGADWFRSFGTEDSPGTMVFTVSGDVRHGTVVELEMGTPLSFLVYVAGGGLRHGRRPKMVVSGVSNPPLGAGALDTPMDFGSMREAGAGLGSGGFVVYDDTACAAAVGAALCGFLANASCGQCPPCKLGTEAIRDRFARLAVGAGSLADVEELAAWVARVTDANRCGLGAGAEALGGGLLAAFPEEFAHHAGGGACERAEVPVPVIEDFLPAEGRVVYAGAR